MCVRVFVSVGGGVRACVCSCAHPDHVYTQLETKKLIKLHNSCNRSLANKNVTGLSPIPAEQLRSRCQFAVARIVTKRQTACGFLTVQALRLSLLVSYPLPV